MKSKFFTLFAAFTLLFGANVMAQELTSGEFIVNGIKYNGDAETQTASVIGVEEGFAQAEVNIPETVNGFTVTTVGDRAFANNKTITSVTLPNSVISIEDMAFGVCTNLQSISLGSSLETIGERAFWECSKLTAISIPNTVGVIGESAFYGCSSLQHVELPNSLKKIDVCLFKECSKLESVLIPNSVEVIESAAFMYCESLKSITIPSSVVSIIIEGTLNGYLQFDGCSQLESIVVEEGNPVYDSRNNANAIIETSTNTLIIGCNGSTIPEGVERIQDYAFYDFNGLESVTLPSTLKEIGVFAFCNTGLNSIEIPASIVSLGEHSFNGCESLRKAVLPNTLTSIPASLFIFCRSLEEVNIPNGVESIGDMAFRRCGFSAIEIPTSVKTIGEAAFQGCVNMETITIPSSVTSISEEAFQHCDVLHTVISQIETPFAIESNVFSRVIDGTETPTTATLYVPEDCKELYKSTEGWDQFATILEEGETPEPEAAYYWYVGTSEPTELNGAVINPETDKWVEIGGEMPSYINVETANKYDYWYVLMPTEFDFCPHNSDGSTDESVVWTSTTSSIPGYTLWSRNDKTLKLGTIFKKLGELPYNANSDYWYLGHIDPTTMTEINPINVNNIFFTEGGSWEELIDPSAMIELIVTPKEWDSESMKSLWYVAMPASSGYTPQDADLWETSTATIVGKGYVVYKSDYKTFKLETAFLPEGYVEENPDPEPEPTPEPASVAFTFTRGADVAVNVEGIEGVTASIEAAPAAYLTTAAAANDSILCINQNTSTATADTPNKYTLTITNNSGVDLAFDYINVCGVALNSAGNFQGLSTVRDRVFVVSYGDNTLAPATMRICDDSHCSGVATVNTFEAVDAIPAGSTYVIGVSIYTDGGAGCFYGLTRITLGKNEPEGGDVTNIESPVLEAQGSQLIYDLTGRRVEKAEKGIYIVGGRKVVIK